MGGGQYGLSNDRPVGGGHHRSSLIHGFSGRFVLGLLHSHGYLTGWSASSRAVDMSLKQGMCRATKRATLVPPGVLLGAR